MTPTTRLFSKHVHTCNFIYRGPRVSHCRPDPRFLIILCWPATTSPTNSHLTGHFLGAAHFQTETDEFTVLCPLSFSKKTKRKSLWENRWTKQKYTNTHSDGKTSVWLSKTQWPWPRSLKAPLRPFRVLTTASSASMSGSLLLPENAP